MQSLSPRETKSLVQDDTLSGWTEKKLQSTSQSQTCTKKKKKVKAVVWWSAAGLIHYSFLNPSEPITSEKHAQQINEMHRKLQCLQLALANRKASVLLHDHIQQHLTQPTLQTLSGLGDEVSPCLPYSPDLSPPDYHFFKHLDNFLQEKLFYNQQDAGNTFQEFPRFLHYKTYFSLAKKY